ncbi:hypothetical protein V8E36_007305 [Tilletia maclaganii]
MRRASPGLCAPIRKADTTTSGGVKGEGNTARSGTTTTTKGNRATSSSRPDNMYTSAFLRAQLQDRTRSAPELHPGFCAGMSRQAWKSLIPLLCALRPHAFRSLPQDPNYQCQRMHLPASFLLLLLLLLLLAGVCADHVCDPSARCEPARHQHPYHSKAALPESNSSSALNGSVLGVDSALRIASLTAGALSDWLQRSAASKRML